jgi:type VI secretion system protein ImpG
VRYRPFFGFEHSLGGAEREGAYFRSRLEPAVGGEGTDTYLTLIAGGEDAPPGQTETITADLLCTNRHLPGKLGVGDIRIPTPGTPPAAKFRNVSAVAPSVPPPLESDVYWRALSHMALNWIPLTSAEGLRGILALYNFRARVDRKAEQAHRLLLQGIQGVTTERATRLLRGTAVRGTSTSSRPC